MIPTYIRRKDGSIYINPAKRHVRPFWLTSQGPGATPEVIAIPAGGTTAPIPFPVDSQGSFEIFYTLFEATDDQIDVNIFDPGTRRNLMNRPVDITTIAGSFGGTPLFWPESYFLNVENGPRQLQVTFTDRSGAPNNVRFVFYGRRLYQNEAPPDVQEKMIEYFKKKERTNVYFLTTDEAVTIPALGTLAGPTAPIFEATDEADTEVLKMTLRATSTNFTWQLRELRSNRTLSNNPIHGSEWGTGNFPFLYQESLMIERNYDVALELTDLSGAPNNLFPTLIARRLYYQ